MNLSLEIIYKLVIAFSAFYMFYRFLIPLIIQYIEKSKNSKANKGRSIDQMIREQEILLRKGMTDESSKVKNHINDKSKTETIEDLLNKYKSIDVNDVNENNSNYESVIELLENLQWGESESSRSIELISVKKYGIKIHSAGINRSIKDNYRLDFFQSLPNFEQIKEFIISYNILLKTVDKSQANQISCEISAMNALLSPKHIIKGAHLLLIKNDLKNDFNEINYRNILLNSSPIFNKSIDSKLKTILNSIFSIEDNRPINPNFLIDKIISESMVVLAAIPIDLSDSPSREEALTFFNILNKNDLRSKNLNKIYKKFAQICHPDKISGKKLPTEFIENANRNFIKVKNAYDILTSGIKK